MSRAVCHPCYLEWWLRWFGYSGCNLIGSPLSYFCLQVNEHCYVMKEVLNFTLEEVLLPESDRFQPYMKEAVAFLENLSNKLSQCVSSSLSLCSPTPVHLPSLLVSFRAFSSPILTAFFYAGSKRYLSDTIIGVIWNHRVFALVESYFEFMVMNRV